MAIEITWLGHASFRIQGQESIVYVDPWKLQQAPGDADVVFVSHSHYDHCSPEDVQKVSKEDTTLVAPADTIARLGASNAITPGDGWTIHDVTVEAVAAYNVGKKFHPKGQNWLGAVITIDGERIYYAGDTDRIPEMNDLSGIGVALMPVGGTYTLSAEEAAEACKAFSPRVAIPYHWGDIVGGESDAENFAKLAPCEVHVLQPGESVRIED